MFSSLDCFFFLPPCALGAVILCHFYLDYQYCFAFSPCHLFFYYGYLVSVLRYLIYVSFTSFD